MKKTVLKESKVLLDVRRVKEEIAGKQITTPATTSALTVLEQNSWPPTAKRPKKRIGIKPREILVVLESYMLDL